MKNIIEALQKLDPQNDNHWTEDGLPRLETVKFLSGDASLTRQAVTAVAPDFNREAAKAAAGAEGGGAGSPVPGAPEGAPQGAAGAANGADSTVPPAPPPASSDLPNLNPPSLVEQATDQADLKAQIEEAKLNLSDRIEQLHMMKQQVSDAQDEVARLEQMLLEATASTGNIITEYHARQRKLLEERAARQMLIKDSGINLKELAQGLKAPIDAAMARKNTRGGTRPQRV